jgi:hypothetical protein
VAGSGECGDEPSSSGATDLVYETGEFIILLTNIRHQSSSRGI